MKMTVTLDKNAREPLKKIEDENTNQNEKILKHEDSPEELPSGKFKKDGNLVSEKFKKDGNQIKTSEDIMRTSLSTSAPMRNKPRTTSLEEEIENLSSREEENKSELQGVFLVLLKVI